MDWTIVFFYLPPIFFSPRFFLFLKNDKKNVLLHNRFFVQ